jgi:hypothetical protein
MAFVGEQRCCVPGCGHHPVQVHHLTCGPEPKGRGIKASDCYTVPVCFEHHGPGPSGSIHDHGNERAWWEFLSVDPVAVALNYWRRSLLSGRVPWSARAYKVLINH